jgi:predicted nucleic-acid-binding protein
MRAVDTNVLVRLFVNDDPKQFAAATQALAAEPVYIPKSVLVELEWVLRAVYGHSRTVIGPILEGLMSKADVEIEDDKAVSRALDWFKRGMDFADAVHLASSRHVRSFLTFDAALRRRVTVLGAAPRAEEP